VHKPVKVVNIKPKNGKIYFETEEEVDKYVNQVKEDILKAFKEGKRVRLQYNN
jgi:cell division septum initiation protein DivIVA